MSTGDAIYLSKGNLPAASPLRTTPLPLQSFLCPSEKDKAICTPPSSPMEGDGAHLERILCRWPLLLYAHGYKNQIVVSPPLVLTVSPPCSSTVFGALGEVI